MMTTQDWITWALTNFSMSMFLLAVIFIILHRIIVRGRVPEYEIVYRWMAVFGAGLTGFYAFAMHAFFPAMSAANIGWAPSPFQFEVAVADLGFGLIAFLSFKASYGFRLASVLGLTCWLWGAAVGHIIQMVKTQNFAPGNAGSWFWMDIVIPLILLICIIKLRPSKTA